MSEGKKFHFGKKKKLTPEEVEALIKSDERNAERRKKADVIANEAVLEVWEMLGEIKSPTPDENENGKKEKEKK